MRIAMRDALATSVVALFATVAIFIGLSSAAAAVMESTNYRIESDSINFAGGLSSSTNYTLESTAGEAATGESASASYNLKAGYQQMVTTFISMTAPSSVTMTPSIPGVSGGIANGSTTVTVRTDSAAGYELSIASTESPALTMGADSIADYAPAGADPDFTFSTGATESHFGYSPSGLDTVSRFLDDGAACNTGALDTALSCWDGLSTTSEAIARSSGANTPDGTVTTVNFRVSVGGSVTQKAGTYTATTTLTAFSL
ncbi:MAG TPA: hypothetical protein VFS75_00350 [Candidatus Paceibacterota bacterium]|nr:hypothetical protein [Candidatus Paceibacterota bacterium]